MIEEKDWVWTGYARHFIGGSDCRFFMGTEIGDYLVSTVGEYRPKGTIEEIGNNRTFETMVFPLSDDCCSCGCGMRTVGDLTELEFEGYNTPLEAREGHMRMCYLVANGEHRKSMR